MIHWQAIIVAIVVLAAAVYVAREIWRAVAPKGGGSCGSCGSCEAKNSPEITTKQLVTLDAEPRGKAPPRRPKP